MLATAHRPLGPRRPPARVPDGRPFGRGATARWVAAACLVVALPVTSSGCLLPAFEQPPEAEAAAELEHWAEADDWTEAAIDFDGSPEPDARAQGLDGDDLDEHGVAEAQGSAPLPEHRGESPMMEATITDADVEERQPRLERQPQRWIVRADPSPDPWR